MKNWKGILKSKELTYILLSIIAILLVLVAYLNFNNMATALYDRDGKNPKAKGELFTTYLSIIGGCAVIYGLYLNNKRIEEQTRQNDIAKKQTDAATDNNNDKRFGDAVGYLSSDNISIVLGGIYILYQLAKEDSRYISLVNNLYSGYLKDKSREFYTDDRYITKPPVVIQAIIDIYFNKDSVFKDEQIDLSDTTLIIVNFNGMVNNCLFKNANLSFCHFNKGLSNCDFGFAYIRNCHFENGVHKCYFRLADMQKCDFKDVDAEYILSYFYISGINMKEVTFDGYRIDNMDWHIARANACKFKFEK